MISTTCSSGSWKYTPRPPSLRSISLARSLPGSAQNGSPQSWMRVTIGVEVRLVDQEGVVLGDDPLGRLEDVEPDHAGHVRGSRSYSRFAHR